MAVTAVSRLVSLNEVRDIVIAESDPSVDLFKTDPSIRVLRQQT